MRLVALAAHDFLSFRDLDLDFDGLGQVAVVGENGAGKSSLLDMVRFTLGGVARARGEQLIREDAEGATWVRSTWERSGEQIVITRGLRPSTLTIEVDGVSRTRHTIADTQTYIERLLGLPFAALLAGPLMVQGESDALMAATPAERKDVLARLFGLERYEQLAAAAKERALGLATLVKQAEVDLTRLDAVLATEAECREAYDQALSDLEEAQLADRKAEVSLEAGREQEREREAMAKRLAELEEGMRAAHERMNEATAQLSHIDRDIAEQQAILATPIPSVSDSHFEMVQEWQQLSVALTEAESQAHLLADVPCKGVYADCQFLVRAHAAAATVPAIRARVQEFGATPLRELKAMEAALEKERRRADVLVERRANAKQWLDNVDVLRRGLSVTLDANRKAMARSVEEAQELTEVLALFPTADTKALEVRRRDARTERDRAATALGNAATQMDSVVRARTEYAAVRERFESLTEQAGRFIVLMRAFGRDGIPLLILENGIPTIEERANDILGRMPGGLRLTLQTQRENKTGGGTRDTLDVLVAVNGHERSYSLLSGGERLRVDFALRVSVAGIGEGLFSTLILDETFGTQDAAGRQSLLECLAAIRDDFGLIVVVSHQQEVIDRFPIRVRVEKTAEVSSAEVVFE